MTNLPNPAWRYSVRVRHAEPHHGRVVVEASFESAALAYVEDFPLAPDQGPEISLVVRDIESGREHCFRIDLETGETTPCA